MAINTLAIRTQSLTSYAKNFVMGSKPYAFMSSQEFTVRITEC